MILDNMREEDPWPGWSLDYNRYGELRFSDTSAQLRKIANNTSRNRIVIRRGGGKYTVFAKNLPDGGIGEVTEADIGHPLYVGAYYNLGNVSRFMVGTVYSLAIFGTAWSDTECKAWRADSGYMSVRRTLSGGVSQASTDTAPARISAAVFTVVSDWTERTLAEMSEMALDELAYKEV